jgi:hypothetical protein
MQTVVAGIVMRYSFTHRRLNGQGDASHAK